MSKVSPSAIFAGAVAASFGLFYLLSRNVKPGVVSKEERFDILDGVTGKPTGETKPRSAVHRDGDWHAAVHIWVVDEKGNTVIQKRAKDKDSWAGFWDISCAG